MVLYLYLVEQPGIVMIEGTAQNPNSHNLAVYISSCALDFSGQVVVKSKVCQGEYEPEVYSRIPGFTYGWMRIPDYVVLTPHQNSKNQNPDQAAKSLYEELSGGGVTPSHQ